VSQAGGVQVRGMVDRWCEWGCKCAGNEGKDASGGLCVSKGHLPYVHAALMH
jgi:hypothetical protein